MAESSPTHGVNDAAELQYSAEQGVVDEVYGRLDALRVRAAKDLAGVRAIKATGTHQGRSERDSYATMYEDRLAQLWAVEAQLVFGRLDLADGDHRYVGLLGIGDDTDGRLLIDWRAPAATAFYQATAARPLGVARRRHLQLKDRTVTSIEDDVLDLAATRQLGLTDLHGEGALMAAVSSARTGRMSDIVATIQAEQDQIIRDDDRGVLVVQGGPGTGKTAVALHRAAYLLYTHRERLAKSGVLVMGPSRGFMRYIEQVLPALGETGTVMMTGGELFPGVTATAYDEGATARIKGDLRMVETLRRAVEGYQRVPTSPIVVKYADVTLTLKPRDVAAAVDNARRTRKPHNEARATYLKTMTSKLVELYARATRTELQPEERAEVLADLVADPHIVRSLNAVWLPLTAPLVLRGLYALPYRLDAAAPHLTERERMALWRDHDEPFTVDDVPLLDDIAELLGDTDDQFTGPSGGSNEAFAQEVLDMTNMTDMVSARDLAARFAEGGPALSVADRAMADRTWVYGHAVIDEAQELSPMMWRTVMRRVPSKSITAVGDVAQTRSVAGASTWGGALDPLVGERFRVRELTVNYRTPTRIMDVAVRVGKALGLPVQETTSVREGDVDPVVRRVDDVEAAAVDAVADALADVGEGRVAVICAQAALDGVARAVKARSGAAVGRGVQAVDEQVAVMAASASKGLEFDAVVVVEPGGMLVESARGAGDVFVALTRATRRLEVLYTGEPPAGFV